MESGAAVVFRWHSFVVAGQGGWWENSYRRLAWRAARFSVGRCQRPSDEDFGRLLTISFVAACRAVSGTHLSPIVVAALPAFDGSRW